LPNVLIENKSLLNEVIAAAKLLKDGEAEYLAGLVKTEEGEQPKISQESLAKKFHHPLDDEICSQLQDLLPKAGTEVDFYANIDAIKSLWEDLLGRSIKCLRLLDRNEPYQHKDKEPIAYGLENLKKFFQKYAKFESLLYGSNHSYRDHIVHVFQTWLLGVLILFNKKNQPNGDLFIKEIHVEGFHQKSKEHKNIPMYEALSMWTIIALCHDLGYPLQKANEIMDATNKMMESFVYNPKTSLDVRFSGVQDNINDHILKFISSRMITKKVPTAEDKEIFTGRVQPKYYIKFSKSLEQYSHGIISSVILYKTLVYFLETDFNINEDYYYDEAKVAQYYLRRDILRAIAAHTCDEIYHMHSTTLSFLLIVCDDLQEWGRKSWEELYRGHSTDSKIITELKRFNKDLVHIEEEVKIANDSHLLTAIQNISWQLERYKRLFRDGQDTDNRSFNFIKDFKIRVGPSHKYNIKFVIPKDTPAELRMIFHEGEVKDDQFFVSLGVGYEPDAANPREAIIKKVPSRAY